MDVHNTIGGSLQISTEVIAKIARLAALEVDGVADVATGTSQNVRSLLGRTGLQKPVTVVMEDGIATVTVHLTVVYGSKVMPLCEKVQENVKQTIQNMTGITVSRVDVLVVGLTDAAGGAGRAAPAAAARHRVAKMPSSYFCACRTRSPYRHLE
ncbi:MAG: Asp23/Gls24 family envelope stress response protein [Gemmiger formicilis]